MGDEILFKAERIFIENVGESDVREIKEVGKEIIIYLTHALSVEQAQRLVNKNLYVHSEFLSKVVAPDVIGLPVFLEGQSFGHVVDIQEGLQDLLIIEALGKEYLLPFEAPYVRIEEDAVYLRIFQKGYSSYPHQSILISNGCAP